MDPDLIIGLLSGLLTASLAANGALWAGRHSAASAWRTRARTAEDAQRASELRSAEQIDAFLDRVGTSPRIEMQPPKAPKVDLSVKHYIPDTEDGDADWNAFKGEPDQVAVKQDETTA